MKTAGEPCGVSTKKSIAPDKDYKIRDIGSQIRREGEEMKKLERQIEDLKRQM